MADVQDAIESNERTELPPEQRAELQRVETREWLESLEYVLASGGPERVTELLDLLEQHATRRGVLTPFSSVTPYVNTIPPEEEPPYPGDLALEKRIRALVRWNAMAMVVRANKESDGIGGHISTYASASTLYEIGFHHFFRGPDAGPDADHVYFQGHASPGIYARAYLERRFDVERLRNFRRELQSEPGLSSYPHPWLMPDFWQFPTVSMGLGPLLSIYQARFNRYLVARDLKPQSTAKVWAYLGDGETDEPETLGAIKFAARERLDNLIWVVNCNLQRLDGPVYGNGSIIQELEGIFRGAGWNVIKVAWGSKWDELLAKDHDGVLARRFNRLIDGESQRYAAFGASELRERFFDSPELQAMIEDWSDDELAQLNRGGHDPIKVYAAYHRAMQHQGSPTVILARTVKGYALGEAAEGKNVTHQQKKLDEEEMRAYRDRLKIPISDDEIAKYPFYRPDVESEEYQYLKARREALGGWMPQRSVRAEPIAAPGPDFIEEFMAGTKEREVSTTMVFVSVLRKLLRDKDWGQLVVPIIPDEARTFGLDSIFPSAKIFNTNGQNYLPVDRELMLSYKESEQGQIMHTGINEAGSAAAFQAVGTSYATHGEPLVPFYIFYSMFGFQRTGDQFWAAGDQLTRGFIIGATAGRTTLAGEGLQHADGHSPLIAGTNSAVIHYDPAYGYEIRHIVKDGLQRMYGPEDGRDPNVMYYLTVYNEPVTQPAEPEDVDVEGILKGIHRVSAAPEGHGPEAQILASGVAVPWAYEAQEMLLRDYGVRAAIWSVTSWSELRREALACEEATFLYPEQGVKVPYLTQKLQGAAGPFIATSDYDHLVVDQIRAWIPGEYATLGADGFGFSDTRAAARRFFHIDGASTAVRVLQQLERRGEVPAGTYAEAIRRYELHDVRKGTSGNAGGDA